MKPVIMILGAGMMQLPAYKAAKKNNWITIGADGNSDAPCRPLADYFLPVDLKDRIQLAERAGGLRSEIGLDGVFTCGTDFSSSVAWIAQELDLPGIPYKTALDCTDKIRMRNVFYENGIPSPPYREVSDGMDPVRESSSLCFPVVVKPVDNMGGRGVVTVDHKEALPDAVGEAIRFSRTGRAIIEEFMDGPEFSLDSLVYKGNHIITGFADRHIFFPPCFIEMGHTLPTALEEEQKNEVIRVFKEAVKALGIENGAAKGDIKLTSKGVMIGEIAARLSGGYMSGWTYPYASDVPLVEKAMLIAMGRDPEDLSERSSRTSSERAFLSIPGKVKSIENLEEAHDTEGVRDLFLLVEEGDCVQFPVNNVSKCGNIIAVAENRETALKASEEAIGKIRVVLETGNQETQDFLEEPLDTVFPPSAYSLKCSDWLEQTGLKDFKPDYTMKYAPHLLPLPDRSLLKKKDWHGIMLETAVNESVSKGNLEIMEEGEWTLFARHYWHAMIRGGIQGVQWFLDHNEDR